VRAWRWDVDAQSVYEVRTPSGTCLSPAVDAGAYDETVALAPLDDSALLAVYGDGQGQQWATILGADGSEVVAPTVLGAERYRAALAATADGIYVAWREPAVAPDAGTTWDDELDELWLQKLTWDGAVLDASAEPIALPRMPDHQAGDQARPALAAAPYWPSGALLAAWDDLTSDNYAGQPEHGDVVIELIPTPIFRTLLPH
jgi:hypothetical protein